METSRKVNRKIEGGGVFRSWLFSERTELRRPPSAALRFALAVAALLCVPVLPGIVRATGQEVFLPLSRQDLLFGLPGPCVRFAGGFVAFAAAFAFRRIPAVSYVAVHEATHALFGLLFGAKVSKLEIGRESGSIDISRRNAVILLSPYFFPLPLAAVLAVRSVLLLFPPLQGAATAGFFDVAAGIAWGFHLCWTVNALLQRQTDLETYGFFFSVVFLLCLNALVLWLAFAVLCAWRWDRAWAQLAFCVGETCLWSLDALREIFFRGS